MKIKDVIKKLSNYCTIKEAMILTSFILDKEEEIKKILFDFIKFQDLTSAPSEVIKEELRIKTRQIFRMYLSYRPVAVVHVL